MVELADLPLPDDPKLAQNIAHFARALRRAGLPIGPGRVIDAVEAVQAAGFTDRTDFFWALHACLVSKPSESVIFGQVFFWAPTIERRSGNCVGAPRPGRGPSRHGHRQGASRQR